MQNAQKGQACKLSKLSAPPEPFGRQWSPMLVWVTPTIAAAPVRGTAISASELGLHEKKVIETRLNKPKSGFATVFVGRD